MDWDVVVIGGGPAGTLAAARAAELGARTALVTRDALGGMAANDGPVPVRVLAQAARLLREAGQLARYGIEICEPRLDYPRLLQRAREVVAEVRRHSTLRDQIGGLGVRLYEHAGTARFVDPHTVEADGGLRVRAEKIIICAGGKSRRLDQPGSDLVATHSDAWALPSVPPSMLVIGAGATGAQVASIFQAFGSRVQLFHAGPRILPTEDEDVSAEVARAFRAAGMVVHEDFGAIESFEKTVDGIRMGFVKDGTRRSAEAALAVGAVGWEADTAGLNLEAAGVRTDVRGFVETDECLRTSAPHIFAAGDINGGLMLVPQALQEGYVAATNAVRGSSTALGRPPSPIGSFTEPEYAQVGLTESAARSKHGDVVASVVRFDETTRTIIDGRTSGFCKLVVEPRSGRILGCHAVGERAVDIVQIVAIAMAGGLAVETLTRVPLSFPTYAGVLGRAAYRAARMSGRELAPETTAAEGLP